MYTLNSDKQKDLTFNIITTNLNSNTIIKSMLVLKFGSIDISFMALMTPNTISVTIPPLKNILIPFMFSVDEKKISLEITHKDGLIVLWADSLEIIEPLEIIGEMKSESIQTTKIELVEKLEEIKVVEKIEEPKVENNEYNEQDLMLLIFKDKEKFKE